jgi:signal-transduction protein with cAMP-binding, CBS, and nucleotidyltransferase domain
MLLDAADDTIFLNNTINLEDKILSADKSALTVDKNFPVLKVQFLFTFLNISHIFVTDNGQLTGIITKEGFIKKSMSMN